MTATEHEESQSLDGACSIFDLRSLGDIYAEIQELYLSDNRSWIIGYSGGKDSTTIVQLVWNALRHLTPEQRKKAVYVISSDTLVETTLLSAISSIEILTS